jgi:hypothetical protein
MTDIFNDDPTSFGPGPTGNTIPTQRPFFGVVDPNRQGPQGDVHWKLQTIEPSGLAFKNFTVSGQFPVKEDGVTVRMNQVIPDAGTYNMPHPFIQWVRGEVQVISFDVVLFSRDKDEDVLSKFNEMKRTQGFVPELGRIPVCRFTFANIMSVKCMVMGFGDVNFSRPRADGQARKIEFTLTLKRFVPFRVPTMDRNKPVKKSMRRLVGGDDRMYETIARRFYGFDNALYGVRLRREKENRRYPFAAQDGQKVQIPRADKVVVGRLAPTHYALQISREDVSAMFFKRANARNNRFLVV